VTTLPGGILRHDVRVIFAHSDHQSRLLVRGIGGVDLGAAIEKQLDGFEIADSGCRHQCRFSGRISAVGIGAVVEKQLDHRGIAIAAGQVKRTHSVAVRELDVGARAN